MAEEMNENTQGSIPPKVSPLSPVTPAKPGAPRPITIRVRPPVAPGAAAPKPAAPASAPAAAPAAAEPAAPAAAAPAPAAAPAASPTPVVKPATIHLRPVTPAAPAPEAAAPAAAAAPQSPPTPGANPLPPGPKPPSSAQVQAAKSKTSRISLDSAIGVAPVSDPVGPKTIRLKRPADLAAAPTVVSKPVPKAATAPIHQTAPISESAAEVPAAPTVTQKRTLKIRRPGAETPAPAEASTEGGDSTFENLAPIDSLDLGEKHESKAFTVVAVIAASFAAIAMILLTLCLGADTFGPSAGRNDEATINGPELPWIGRIAE